MIHMATISTVLFQRAIFYAKQNNKNTYLLDKLLQQPPQSTNYRLELGYYSKINEFVWKVDYIDLYQFHNSSTKLEIHSKLHNVTKDCIIKLTSSQVDLLNKILI
jgi:hypothetical protein